MTDSKETLIKFLADHYGLTLHDARPLSGAQSSSVYLCDTKGRGQLVLKQSQWYKGFAKNPEEVLETVYTIADLIAAEGVPLQRAIKKENGKYVTTVEESQWALLEYKMGHPFQGEKKEFEEAGKALALFHHAGLKLAKKNADLINKAATIPVEKPYEESRDLYFSVLRDQLLTEHSCSSPDVCRVIRQDIRYIDEAISYIDAKLGSGAKLTVGILHNDFNYANGLYDDTGGFVSFLDVDQLGVGPFVFDIANAIASFATGYIKDHGREALKHSTGRFIASYHAHNPLAFAEYERILAATQRWDVMRILRTLRRHHYENDRLPALMPKITNRFLPRLKEAPALFSFVTPEWIREALA
ncbi:MAG: phosphotransferase [bacterium]|nr:phosphotransferase [bacterium]